jgi:hypothetical protein
MARLWMKSLDLIETVNSESFGKVRGQNWGQAQYRSLYNKYLIR